jgi:N-acetylmuramoyl-L-alanine amidase
MADRGAARATFAAGSLVAVACLGGCGSVGQRHARAFAASDGARATATAAADVSNRQATSFRAPRAALRGLRGKVIVIDPGHNPGNASHVQEIGRPVFAGVPENHGYKACDTAEAAYNWDVARRLAVILRAAGAHVILTRSARRPAYGPCIDRRAAIGNRAHADAAISIHADGGPASGHGFALIAPASPIRATRLTRRMVAADVALAMALRRAFHAGTGLPTSTYLGKRGIYRSNEYGGTNRSHVPKVFIETVNMRNPHDAALLVRASFRARIARALAVGLATYLR